MKRQQQTIDLHTPRALMIPTGKNVSLSGRYAIDSSYEERFRIITRKTVQLILAILITAGSGSALAQTTQARQYQISYLEDAGKASKTHNQNSKGETIMQKIIPFLWYDNEAEEAVSFYVSIFKNSKVGNITRYDEEAAKASGKKEGDVMTIAFQLEGQDFIALNGGPQFKFTEAISFSVDCKSQQEVDELWKRLSEGGEEGPCGWLKDKYGLSWQIVPTALVEMLQDKDAEKTKRVTHAMLQMKKLDIEKLKRAYEQ